jgi:hypothetical protein
MVNQIDLLPLEKFLQDNQNKKDDFPNRSDQYFIRYLNIKNWLQENVYKFIGAGTSAEDGGVYTDHGPDHFNAVINYAGKLIGIGKTEDIGINPYEVFLLITSILFHDAGNVYGRKDHEKNALLTLKDLTSLLTDSFEVKTIAEIAEVHGGRTVDDDPDTIGNKKWDDRREFLGASYRPNMIAALVRFADEICEDCQRAASHLIKNNKLPIKSEVFHYYAHSIKNVSVDRKDKSVSLSIYINTENVGKKFGKNDKYVYLIDEIMSRLEKMNNERIYCSRYMYEIVQLRQIKASIHIVDTDFNVLKKTEFKLEDKGYPSHANLLADEYPEWVGEKLKNSFMSMNEHDQNNRSSNSKPDSPSKYRESFRALLKVFQKS